MGLVEQYVHDPGGQEGEPANHDHHPDLGLCQLMGDAVDINQLHAEGHPLQGRDCQPASKQFLKNQLMDVFTRG